MKYRKFSDLGWNVSEVGLGCWEIGGSWGDVSEHDAREILKKALDKGEKFEPLQLGNVNSKRDWSDSEDFVKGVWMMLSQEEPKEYVLSSNETHSIREFVTLAFQEAGIPGLWSGSNMDEKFRVYQENTIIAEINEKFYRPAEVSLLYGDSNPIREELGWKPEISFDQLVKRMVENDISLSNS